MLANCLRSIAAQEDVANHAIHIVVVDNDATPTSAHIVAGFAIESPFPVQYLHEPRRGIPMARNRVIDAALAIGVDRLAFLDDDQVAHRSYIAKHLEAAERHQADAVQPPIVAIYPKPAPFWSMGTNQDPSKLSVDRSNEGRERKSAGTGGVMFSARLIKSDGMGLRFDERLALAGGEDSAFFLAAHKKGAKIVWSYLPIVMEEVSPSRLTYRRYVMKGLSLGGQLFTQYKCQKGYWRAIRKHMPASLLRIFRGVGQLAISPLFAPFDMNRFKFTAKEGGRNIFVAAGLLGAMLSLQYEYYRQIDGH